MYVLVCVDLALAAIAFVLPSSKWDNPQLMSTMCHILDCAGLGSSTLKLSGTYNTSNGHVQWTMGFDLLSLLLNTGIWSPVLSQDVDIEGDGWLSHQAVAVF